MPTIIYNLHTDASQTQGYCAILVNIRFAEDTDDNSSRPSGVRNERPDDPFICTKEEHSVAKMQHNCVHLPCKMSAMHSLRWERKGWGSRITVHCKEAWFGVGVVGFMVFVTLKLSHGRPESELISNGEVLPALFRLAVGRALSKSRSTARTFQPSCLASRAIFARPAKNSTRSKGSGGWMSTKLVHAVRATHKKNSYRPHKACPDCLQNTPCHNIPENSSFGTRRATSRRRVNSSWAEVVMPY